jgi:hypothetical protein
MATRKIDPEWLERNQPRTTHPHDCSYRECGMRCGSAWDVAIGKVIRHFCSREHMMMKLAELYGTDPVKAAAKPRRK